MSRRVRGYAHCRIVRITRIAKNESNASSMKRGLLGVIISVGALLGLSLLASASTTTAPNLKVAFIGDQGLNDNAKAVSNLIKAQGADVVLHQGDFDYHDDPDAWDQQINSILGEDFPYLRKADQPNKR